MKKVITKGAIYTEKMSAYEKEIAVIENSLSKLEARRTAAKLSDHSSEYLYSNLRFAIQYLDEAPPDAQKALLRALIKAIEVHDEHIIMRMYVSKPTEEMACHIDPQKQGTLPDTADNSTSQGSPERQQWRVVVDGRRTLQPLEIPLLIKLHRKRGMGWLIALDEPIFNKPTKTKESKDSTPYYHYTI